MLTLITANPGGGKTALAIALLLKEYKDRPLYNDGVKDLALDHVPLDVMEWHKEVPDGAVIVVDEVQRRWRPRGPGSAVPKCIEELETHRHRGIDFILITQKPTLVDKNVRDLTGRHLHIRDTWNGRWLYEWPECEPAIPWKRCENKRRFSLPKHVFGMYTSASMHIKPVRGRPVLLYFIAAAVLALLYICWTLYSSFQTESAPPAASAPAPAVVQQAPALGQGLAGALGMPSASSSSSRLIDDRTDWIPRISNRPESAPAFDDLRKVQQFPVVAGGVCFKGECKCFTQQGTQAGLGHDECLAQMDSPRFDAYSAPAPVQQAQAAAPASVDPATSNSPEIKHAVAAQNHEAQQAVTRAARTALLASTGGL